ncbi:MAG: polysaccharide deacetylase family protein [Gemmobacter sp.]
MPETHVGILFHGIGTPARALEPGEAPYWVAVDAFEDLLDRIAAHPLRDRIRISFDDGNLSDHDIALPRLLARGLTADFFVLAGRIGQPGSLDAGQIRALAAAGMGVGSHGIAHRAWAGMGADLLREELEGSRDRIGTILGTPVRAAGIPFGAWDARVLRALVTAGYDSAWSSDRGRFDPQALLRPRRSVRGTDGPAEFAEILTGSLPPLRRLRRFLGMTRRRWSGS